VDESNVMKPDKEHLSLSPISSTAAVISSSVKIVEPFCICRNEMWSWVSTVYFSPYLTKLLHQQSLCTYNWTLIGC